MAKYSYLRINASGDTPCEFVNLADSVKRDEEWDVIKASMSHASEGSIYLTPQKFTLWCSDGKRYQVEFYYDEDGISKGLFPNHRFNAMAHAGRFTTKKFNYIGKSYQEELKTWWGSNFAVGDVILKFQSGKPLPDVSVFGENPIKFLLEKRTPNTRMVNKFGDRADKVIHPNWGKEFQDGSWERKDYHISCRKGDEDDEYQELVGGWLAEMGMPEWFRGT